MSDEVDTNWPPPTPKSSDKLESPTTEPSKTPATPIPIPQQPATSPPASGTEAGVRADPQWVDALNAYFAKRWVEAVDRFEALQARYPGENLVETRLEQARQQRDIAAWSAQAEAQAKIREADLAERYGQALNHLDQEHWQQAAELFTTIQQEQPGFRDAPALLADVRRHLEPSDRPQIETTATQSLPGRGIVAEPPGNEPKPIPPPQPPTTTLPAETTSSSRSSATASNDAFEHAHMQGREDRGVLARYSPQAQAAISAALLIPTMVLYFVWFRIPYPDDRALAAGIAAGFILIYSTYFVVVVGFVARNRQRRGKALPVAIVAAVVDTAYSWYTISPGALAPFLLDRVIFTLLVVIYVAAWGIARRQHRSWVIGLALATVVAGVCQIGIPMNYHYLVDWWTEWALYTGVFAIGCLICWAFDVAGRRRDLKSPETP